MLDELAVFELLEISVGIVSAGVELELAGFFSSLAEDLSSFADDAGVVSELDEISSVTELEKGSLDALLGSSPQPIKKIVAARILPKMKYFLMGVLILVRR